MGEAERGYSSEGVSRESRNLIVASRRRNLATEQTVEFNSAYLKTK